MKTVQQTLSRYRTELKGIAILWILLFHMKQENLEGVIDFVMNIGYGGVDIFLFLSGFGLYYSLRKNGDLSAFYKKRALRILPGYYPICILWLIVSWFLYDFSMGNRVRIIAGNLTMLGFFANVPITVNWYIGMLVITILLAPLLYRIIAQEKHRPLIWCGLLGFSVLFGISFLYENTYMAISRFPVFLLGMMTCAWKADGDEQAQKKQTQIALAVCAAALAAGIAFLVLCYERYPYLLITYAMFWHPFALIAPALCVLLSFLLAALPCQNKLLWPLRKVGEASYGIFLCNVFFEMVGNGLKVSQSAWVVLGAVSLITGLCYHQLIKKLTVCIEKRLST